MFQSTFGNDTARPGNATSTRMSMKAMRICRGTMVRVSSGSTMNAVAKRGTPASSG